MRHVSASTVTAGLLAVVVSYAGPLLIYLQAANAMQVSPGVFSSWVFAISVAAGISSISLSLWFRAPVAMAWSAPGTVLLISLGTSLSPGEVVGAYVAVAMALVLLAASGLFDILVRILPSPVTNGMMAGILFSFGLKAIGGLAADPMTFALLVAAFVVLSATVPRYAILGLLGMAAVLTVFFHDAPVEHVRLSLAEPHLVAPAFSAPALLGLAVPLLITTLGGQFLPGMAILRANGFHVATRPILMFAGVASLAGAFLGGITTALASITAAFCAGPECHEDPTRRYVAGVACGVFFCIGGIFSGTIADLLVLLPTSMITLLAGLALLGPIQKSLTDTMNGSDVQSGLMTFLVTASGVEIAGVGSAFWGVGVGLLVWHLAGFTRKVMGRS
ncbi:MAG: benzoate/H(+) symporter BenE family transporter [Rhodobacteraceae bacterium]|nr:benzoate/H(+) symporter BenE family transporter [Paracoccaceae bacterium]